MAETRDVRSSKDWVDGDSIETDRKWMDGIHLDENELKSEVEPAFIPLTDDAGNPLSGRDGHSMGIRSVVTRSPDELKTAWAKKQARDPCWMCRHFVFRALSRNEKLLLVRKYLVKEHGWTEEAVKGDIGNVDAYEWCRVYELMTHKMASCPRHFQLREDLPPRRI